MISSCLVISEEDLGQRLDKILKNHFPDHSRTYFQYLIDEECVLVNGLLVKKQYRPAIGDEIEISFQLTPEIDVKPEAIPLDILYEDDHLLIINKPAGMVVHPAPGSPSGTFANALLYHCSQLNPAEFATLRPGIVHRIDKETTGVLIGVKTSIAHKKMVEKFATRSIEKHYLAICCGVPKEGTLSAPIKRHPIKRQEMTVSDEGKEAISHFKILERNHGLCLITVQLITGRTHQIRAHLKHLNCPLLGDPVYGSKSLNEKYRAVRPLLHAHTIKFTHPISGVPLEIVAPIPPDMKNFIEFIRPC
ncbi:MAG: RluA family pseudouridine synthase [Verrucomicrobia bacterium]|nr:RluA family pseudouridine synthase [Verrucomicrobiota bacterium]